MSTDNQDVVPAPRLTVGRVVGRGFLCLGILLLVLLVTVWVGLFIVCRGPSPAARDLFVISAMETSAAKFVPSLFLSEGQIEAIMQSNTVQETQKVTDETLVQLPTESTPDFDLNAVTIEDVGGATYKGKLLIVNDPSRVYVATPPEFSPEVDGVKVEAMVKRDGALAGVNGGGFKDEDGMGRGGEPLGIVITQGALKAGNLESSYEVIGIDNNHKLVVGRMTAQAALDRGIRDAVSFGPTLIINGEPVEVTGTGGGLNPRTAIGQRADGSMLLLVIDGRQPHSLGASFKDLIDVMVQYGAVNAANLDGGSSSLLVYNDEIVTKCASLYGSRRLPTAILVK